MDIRSLNEYVKSKDNGIYDLFVSTFAYNTTISLSEYKTDRDDEMRIDLIFQKMYNLENNEVGLYLGDIYVILFINNIDNPLNITQNMILKYPTDMGQLNEFRVSNTDADTTNSGGITGKLSFRKSTIKDGDRQKFIENDFSLSPVVLGTPAPAVSIQNGKFVIGGLR